MKMLACGADSRSRSQSSRSPSIPAISVTTATLTPDSASGGGVPLTSQSLYHQPSRAAGAPRSGRADAQPAGELGGHPRPRLAVPEGDRAPRRPASLQRVVEPPADALGVVAHEPARPE